MKTIKHFNKQRNIPSVVMVGACLLLGACSGNVKETLGLKKDAPDEFRVLSKPPLSVPPNFNLRPPRKGEIAPQSSVRKEAKEALYSSSSERPGETFSQNQGDAAFLNKVGVNEADPHIKAILAKDAQKAKAVKEDKGILKRLLPKSKEETPDLIVDASGESQRIKDNKASDKPVTEGQTPTIDPNKKGLFGRLFSGSDDE